MFLKKIKLVSKIILAILLIIMLIVSIISILFYTFAKGFYDEKIEIVEKKYENIGETIDIELPNIDEEIEFVKENKFDYFWSDNKEVNISDIPEKSEVIPEQAKESIYKEEAKNEDIINVLLTGMDARSYDTRSRADTIILLSYNKSTKEIKMVSFMRDSWIYLVERGWSRINAATVYGGTGLLINSINYNFGLDIQNYVEIKFDDFIKVIDILGGIDIELSQGEIDYINNKLHIEDNDFNNDINSSAGIVHLNGKQTLWHCRNRTIGYSDFTRTERQREVLEIIIKQTLECDIFTILDLIYDLQNYVNTNIPIGTIIELTKEVLTNGISTIETARIPFDEAWKSSKKNGASVLELDINKNKELLESFLGY